MSRVEGGFNRKATTSIDTVDVYVRFADRAFIFFSHASRWRWICISSFVVDSSNLARSNVRSACVES